jgi:hypothetical protein
MLMRGLALITSLPIGHDSFFLKISRELSFG